jgi:hypothetical protein
LIFPISFFVNAAYIWWFRARAEIARNPSLEPGYRRLILGCLIYGNIPYLILGAGIELFPALPFLPFLIACFATVLIYLILGSYWVFFGGGAEDLARHPGFWRPGSRDPEVVKLGVMFFLVLGITAIIVLVTVWWHSGS